MVSSQKPRQDNLPKAEDLISLDTAATLSGMSSGHIRFLIREGDMWGTKIGRNWVTTEKAVREYQARAQPRGRPKKT
jgi:hypothetical protein